MKRLLCAVLVPLLLVAGIGLAPAPPAAAQDSSDPIVGDVGDGEGFKVSIGVLAAAGCGFFVRWTVLTAGTQVGIIAGAVACCTLALFDGLT